MKKLTFAKTLALTSVLALSNNTFSFNTDFLSVSTNAEISSGADLESNWQDTTDLSVRLSMTLEAELSDAVRAVIAAELKQALIENGSGASLSSIDLEELIKEAYIEVKMVDGSPVAFIVGKHEMAFGQNFSSLAMNENGTNSAMDGFKKDEVVGITMQLPTNFFSMVNSIEASVFENGASDLKVGEVNNVAIRIKGDLTDSLEYTASYLNEDGGSDREQTVSLGVIYRDGNWTAHVEGLGFIDNTTLSDTKFAINTGAAYDLGHGVVAVEYTWIEDSLGQLSVSYETEIADGVKIGPQGTYVTSGANAGDASLGVVMKVEGPSTAKRKN